MTSITKKCLFILLLVVIVLIILLIVLDVPVGSSIPTTSSNTSKVETSSLSVLQLVSSSSLSDIEDIYLSVPSEQSSRQSLKYITSVPHLASTKEDWLLANFVKNEFQTVAGISDTTIFDVSAYLNYPVSKPIVQLLGNNNDSTDDKNRTTKILFDAALSEDVLDFDKTSDTIWRNHTFHGYSPSGDVTSQLVFANYGRPQDFDLLESKAGISVQNKIVLVRYGKCFRGLKVMNAQRRGAVGVLIYSDPADDGYVVGKTYPKGPWRSSSGVQRGSVQFLSLCAGDPMRIDRRYASNLNETIETLCGYNHTELIPNIPSLPISYGDALPFLLSLQGTPTAVEVFGPDFNGGLNITYHVGPSIDGKTVRVVVNNQGIIGSIPNVIGKIPGSLPASADMPVIIGNHRDAWVYGAADPNSGTSALLEVAKGLGVLLRSGWKPRRTIYLCSWSGEEYGLIGSTSWAELNPHLIQNAVAYINVDTAVSGDMLSVALTPILSNLWEDVLNDLHISGHSLPFGNAPLGQIVDANTNAIMNNHHPNHQILGSGSDYTAFLDHFGISSMDFRFGKRGGHQYGQYHSVYDSFSWMDAYGGSDGKQGSAFSYMVLTAKIWGLLALRLADSDVLPLNHIVQGNALRHYVDAIRKQSIDTLDLGSLDVAVHKFGQAATKLQMLCDNAQLDPSVCNTKLGLAERQFLSDKGLPNRKWFKHVLQAPGMYLGYAAEAFPGVQQAIDDGDLATAQDQIDVAAAATESAARFLHHDDVFVD